MTKSISLTKDKFALVDDGDYEYLNQFKWYINDKGYAVRHMSRLIGKKMIRMHREIINTPENMQTDHINGNRLDNRRCNLRVCSNSENSMNKTKQSNNTSGHKGVTWHKQANKWVAQIRVNGKHLSLGLYNNVEDAAIAYNEAAIKHYGDFARTE